MRATAAPVRRLRTGAPRDGDPADAEGDRHDGRRRLILAATEGRRNQSLCAVPQAAREWYRHAVTSSLAAPTMKHLLSAAIILLLAGGGASAQSKNDLDNIRVEMADRFTDCARREIARDLPSQIDDFAATHARIMHRVMDRCSSEISLGAVSESYGGDTEKPAAFVEGMVMATAAMLANAMRLE
jgi:hypothetical protein